MMRALTAFHGVVDHQRWPVPILCGVLLGCAPVLPAEGRAQTVVLASDLQTDLLLAAESPREPILEEYVQRHQLLHQYLRTRLRALGYAVPRDDRYPEQAHAAWWELLTRLTDRQVIVSVAVVCRAGEGDAVSRLPAYYVNLFPAVDLERGARHVAEGFAVAVEPVGDQLLATCLSAIAPP